MVYAKALKLSLAEEINGVRRKNFFDGTAFLCLGPNDSLVEVFSVELSEISQESLVDYLVADHLLMVQLEESELTSICRAGQGLLCDFAWSETFDIFEMDWFRNQIYLSWDD